MHLKQKKDMLPEYFFNNYFVYQIVEKPNIIIMQNKFS